MSHPELMFLVMGDSPTSPPSSGVPIDNACSQEADGWPCSVPTAAQCYRSRRVSCNPVLSCLLMQSPAARFAGVDVVALTGYVLSSI